MIKYKIMNRDLTDIPNIGKELSARLKAVNINTIHELKSIGSKNAFIRLRTLDPGACINQLYALEGAIQNIRWHSLDKYIMSDLKEFFNRLDKL